MNSKRAFFLMIGLTLIAASSIVGAVIYGNKMLEQDSQKLLALKVDNKVLEQQQTALLKAKKDIAKYSNLEEVTQTIVPQDKDQARAVREVVELANQSGIKLQSITFPASTLGNSSSGTAGAPAGVSQAKPVTGIEGVYSLEMNIVPQNKVSYYQFIDFLAKLEKNRRTSQVTRIKIDPSTPGEKNPTIGFALTINIFVKP